MKKIVIVLAIIISILCLNKQEKVIIPKESIRFRIIANSNSKKDQTVKYKVLNNLSSTDLLTYQNKKLVKNRAMIKKMLPSVSTCIEETLKDEKINYTYNISYGKNYFPRKEYKNVIYEAGEYESLVITLGNGYGENFWCVLFPPLCLIEEDKTNKTDVEYTSIIKEIINKYL